MLEPVLEKMIKKCDACGELDMILSSEKLCSECKREQELRRKKLLEI